MTRQSLESMRDLPPEARALAELIPAVYFARDEANSDRPFLRLIAALAEPLTELSAAIDALHADHFVETASDAALPLLATLVDTPIYREEAPTNRAVIANMVRWLRRRGTVATLEEVIAASSGWSAEVEEAFRSIQITQDLNAMRLNRGRVATLWDPIALADPLSRHVTGGTNARDAALVRERSALIRIGDESVAETLRRLGRADAGRAAIAPRNFDYLGWAEPQVILVRTSRVDAARIEDREAGSMAPGTEEADRGTLRAIPHASRADEGFVGATLDPAGGIERVVWSGAVDPDYNAAQLTEVHEPTVPEPPRRLFNRVLTPTALADTPIDAEAAGALDLSVDGVRLVGSDPPRLTGPAPLVSVVGDAVLRFADADRPSPDDEWRLRLIALETTDNATVQDTLIPLPPIGEPEDSNPALLEAIVTRGSHVAPDEAPVARLARSGATVAVRVSRNRRGRGYRRAANGDWTGRAFGVPGGSALSPAIENPAAAEPQLVRIENRAGGNGIAALAPEGPAGWTFTLFDLGGLAPEDRPDLDAPAAGPAVALVPGEGGTLILIAPDLPPNQDAAARMGLWRIDDPLGTALVTRVDSADDFRPEARLMPSVCQHLDGRTYLYGGRGEAPDGAPDPTMLGTALDDLWSFATTGAEPFVWRPHNMRLPRDGRAGAARVGGRLLSAADGLILIGGASRPGALSAQVLRAELNGPRPRWHRLPDLPLCNGGPGVLWARTIAGGGLDALVWDDATTPRRMTLVGPESRWQSADPERGAPNPPAEGEGLYLGDVFLAIAPPPLPPSEVLVSNGATAQIGFLPALDPAPGDAMLLFEIHQDGTAKRWYSDQPDGEGVRPNLRLGGPRAAAVAARSEASARIGAGGKLAWRPLTIRQCTLQTWDVPLDLDLSNAVGFDPRLGRVLLREAIGRGRLTSTFRSARGGLLGPGMLLPEGDLPGAWKDPDPAYAALSPPDNLLEIRVDPLRAGTPSPAGTYAGDLHSAAGEGGRRVLVDRSPRLSAAWLPLAERTATRIGGTGPGQVAFVQAGDDGVSLSLRERMSPGSDPEDGPSLWLEGLDLGGMLEVQLSSGRVEARLCRLGRAGRSGVSVAGVGLQSGPMLWTLPDASLTLHLYGCKVGRLEIPPWVQLVAAGCTFDSGARDLPAINAPGARLRLRHCTLHGETNAGLLEASSCVFAGSVRVARPDLGWLRFSLLPPGGRVPVLYRSVEQSPSLTSLVEGDPGYLNLDANNGAALLSAGEQSHQPGAYSRRADRVREATLRGDDFVPMGLEARHVDRARTVNLSMNRRLP